MIMPICLYGTRVFDEPVHRITQFNERLVGLVRSMFETLVNGDGIGLAANQIGLPVSLFVMDLSGMSGHEGNKPLAVINPDILSSSEVSVTMEEGCLSIPGIREDVSRPESIIVRFTDGSFQEVQMELSGVSARVFQHEYDHLRQKFFIERLSSVKRQLVRPKLSRIRKGDVDTLYPVITWKDERQKKTGQIPEFESGTQIK